MSQTVTSKPYQKVYVLLHSGEQMTLRMPTRLGHQKIGERVNQHVGSVAVAFRTARTTWDQLKFYPGYLGEV